MTSEERSRRAEHNNVSSEKEAVRSFDLRHQLLYNTPLQKLYEKVYFEDYDLGQAVAKHLNEFKEDTLDSTIDIHPEKKHLLSNEFKKIITKDVQSIDPDIEYKKLLTALPKIEIVTESEKQKRLKDHAKTAKSTEQLSYAKMYK